MKGNGKIQPITAHLGIIMIVEKTGEIMIVIRTVVTSPALRNLREG